MGTSWKGAIFCFCFFANFVFWFVCGHDCFFRYSKQQFWFRIVSCTILEPSAHLETVFFIFLSSLFCTFYVLISMWLSFVACVLFRILEDEILISYCFFQHFWAVGTSWNSVFSHCFFSFLGQCRVFIRMSLAFVAWLLFRAFWAVVTSRNDLLSRLVSVVLCKCYILISIWHSLFVGAQNAKTLISYGFLKHFGAVVRCRNGVFFSFFHWFCKSFLVISIWPLSSAWMLF